MKVLVMIGLLCGFCLINGQVPLNPDPIWSYSYSSPRDIAFGDINNDGYLDLAVVREGSAGSGPLPNYIFMNINGTLESSPSWQSADADYTIGCAFGDVDNDGDPDLAVGNYKLAGGRVKLYKNDHGTLNPSPAWTASSDGAVWVGWGDVDNDGDLDLAAVDLFYYPCVFYNNNGVLESTPSWRATDYFLDLCGAWLDVDDDGDLDLAVGNLNGSVPLLRIYKNNGGVLETSASWASTLPTSDLQSADGLAAGDINGDSWLDVAVTEDPNYAMKNYAFMNLDGQLETNPSWISTDLHSSLRCILGDVDGDGDLDLAVANIQEPGMLYLNNHGSFSASPDWSSNVTGEWGVAFGDIDNDGSIYRVDSLSGDGARKLFYLSRYPVHRLDSVKVNGVLVPNAEYCYVRESGWFSLKNAPSSGIIITVYYRYSIDMELAVGGAYLFENTNNEIKEKNGRLVSEGLELNLYPNPASCFVAIAYTLPRPDYVVLEIYDISGRAVRRLIDGYQSGGRNCVRWDLKDKTVQRISDGIYYAYLKFGPITKYTKLIIIR